MRSFLPLPASEPAFRPDPLLLAAAAYLARFSAVMPTEHGRRLATAWPDARLERVPDRYTLIPLDQPAILADLIDAFVRALPGDRSPDSRHGAVRGR